MTLVGGRLAPHLMAFLLIWPSCVHGGEWDDEDTSATYPAATTVLGRAALKDGASPQLGRTATPEQIAAQNLTIRPNGEGLPKGQGLASQGERLYTQQCRSCHGPQGRGRSAEELVGGKGTLGEGHVPELTVGSYWPYATTLFDYLRRAMPVAHPLSLSADDVYALSAYLLYLNGIISADTVINQETLPAINMPNRNGFVPIYRPLQ